MIEKLKNEIKKLFDEQKYYLKYFDKQKLNAINEKIFALREKLKLEKRLQQQKEYEKKLDEKICEKIKDI